jgi:hypothetical protein
VTTTKTAPKSANQITKCIPIRDRAKLGFGFITATRPARERSGK